MEGLRAGLKAPGGNTTQSQHAEISAAGMLSSTRLRNTAASQHRKEACH